MGDGPAPGTGADAEGPGAGGRGGRGDGVAPGRWNHNIHYGRRLLDLVPDGARDALDVGCGDGWLCRALAQRVPHVVGIDRDERAVVAARLEPEPPGLEYVQSDFLSHPFAPTSFDVVVAVASIHHVDEATALARMGQLVRPGGLVGVVGLARTRSPRDLAVDIAGAGLTRWHRRSKGSWETPAPKVWPPPHSYGQLRRLSSKVLPGRRFRRRALWRYVLTWTKPQGWRPPPG